MFSENQLISPFDVENQFEKEIELQILKMETEFPESIAEDFTMLLLKPMQIWVNKDVMDFLKITFDKQHNIDYDYTTNLYNFESISGNIFEGLSQEYCGKLASSQQLGDIIFNAKERFLRDQKTLLIFPEEPLTERRVLQQANQNQNQNEMLTIKQKTGRSRNGKVSNAKSRKRSQKLWEFLINLLKDSNTCPQLIKWENFQEGMFKFVQNDKVAKMWGSRKKNNKMTYEKFSRAMRYYYKSEILLPVPGKRLVYKFGPQATGWRTLTPLN